MKVKMKNIDILIEKEFQRLLESEEILKEFEKDFSKEIVRADPTKRPLEVTEKNVQKIFDVLNRIFFENKLKRIPIKGMTLKEAMIPIFNCNENNISIDDVDNIRGLNVGIVNSEDFSIVSGSEFIYIQLLEDKKVSFGYILATLLHEMIHNYDNHYGDLLQLFRRKITTGFIYDDHETKVFKKYMKIANDRGIQVKKTIDNSYEMSNEEAQKYLLDLPLGEIKMESSNDKDRFESSWFVKISGDKIRFFCP